MSISVAAEGPPNVRTSRGTSWCARPATANSSNTVSIGPHHLLADEPVAAGGEDTGPGPYDFVLAGLGACTSMTMRLYADRKSFPLERVTVTLNHSKIYARDCAECETKEGMLDQIDGAIGLEGPLDAEQRKRIWKSPTNARCIAP